MSKQILRRSFWPLPILSILVPIIGGPTWVCAQEPQPVPINFKVEPPVIQLVRFTGVACSKEAEPDGFPVQNGAQVMCRVAFPADIVYARTYLASGHILLQQFPQGEVGLIGIVDEQGQHNVDFIRAVLISTYGIKGG